MKKGRVAVLTLLMFLTVLFSVKPVLAEGPLESVEGDIIAVDSAKNIIEVRWMADTVAMRFENITLQISPSTALVKNAQPIELSDIESGDHATIRYDPNAVPLPQAVSVDIEA